MPTATVLTSQAQLFGSPRAPGDVLTAEQIASVSESVLGALVREGVLALEGTKIPAIKVSAKEKRSIANVAAARKVLDEATQEVAGLKEKRGRAIEAVEALIRERAPHLLPAERGDETAKATAKRLLQDLIAARQRASDLETAIHEAESQRTAAETALSTVERGRIEAEAERLKGERLDACRKIEASLAELLPAIEAYRRTGQHFASALGTNTGGQIQSLWRLEAVLDGALGRHVDPARRADVADFAALEGKVLDAALLRAFPAKLNGKAA
jgi:hypothetical protein